MLDNFGVFLQCKYIPDKPGFYWIHQSDTPVLVKVTQKWEALHVELGGVFVDIFDIQGAWIRRGSDELTLHDVYEE